MKTFYWSIKKLVPCSVLTKQEQYSIFAMRYDDRGPIKNLFKQPKIGS